MHLAAAKAVGADRIEGADEVQPVMSSRPFDCAPTRRSRASGASTTSRHRRAHRAVGRQRKTSPASLAVLSTSALALQLVPAIAPDVEQLTVFERTAIWVLPRLGAPLGITLTQLREAKTRKIEAQPDTPSKRVISVLRARFLRTLLPVQGSVTVRFVGSRARSAVTAHPDRSSECSGIGARDRPCDERGVSGAA